ncbi:hypothetical protein [Gallionella capsiferriformans]|uniref:Transmembrane protein n=1 Tax=Gallionella capsiferriformans (strain ES-2) TaxID=395494 RepID=D9SGA8_GALCS|nr:hypothetical protein [Gallionella capsiferriformans]ADL55555.1 hypothetical protein Galf_1536 [Gallionella capsiferriformans ES-2]
MANQSKYWHELKIGTGPLRFVFVIVYSFAASFLLLVTALVVMQFMQLSAHMVEIIGMSFGLILVTMPAWATSIFVKLADFVIPKSKSIIITSAIPPVTQFETQITIKQLSELPYTPPRPHLI